MAAMQKRVVLLAGFMLLAACQSSKITTGVLTVNDAWARPVARGDNGAVYFVIENGTSQDDVLISVQSEIASAVELHRSQMENNHMSMHQAGEIALPAGEAVEFSPGGLHIMLVGLRRDLTTGTSFDITLTFQNAGKQNVTVSVKEDVNND